MEVWKPVCNFEKAYAVSDAGRVQNIRTGRYLTPRMIKGYGWVALQLDGKRVDRAIHHLVLEAFVGLCPDGQEAYHDNDVAFDNRLDNLKWATREENIRNRSTRRLTQAERFELIKAGN